MIHKRQSDMKDKVKSKAGSKRISATKSPPLFPEIADMENKPAETRRLPMLVMDTTTGQIIDTETGQGYWLKPNAQSY